MPFVVDTYAFVFSLELRAVRTLLQFPKSPFKHMAWYSKLVGLVAFVVAENEVFIESKTHGESGGSLVSSG